MVRIMIKNATIIRTIAILLLSTVMCINNALAQQYKIEHLEPNYWWINMENKQLQLLVHGKDIADLTPKISYDGVRIEKVNRVENNNYLFIDLQIDKQAKSGVFSIDFHTKNNSKKLAPHQKVLSYSYELKARRANKAVDKSFSAKDVIYLITPDRFANGNPKNDTVSDLTEGVNRKAAGGRHGGDLEGIINHLDYIADMGFTQIWMMPVVENNQPSYSYHGYSSTNFYQIDARFGSNETYQMLSEKAQEKGIGLIIDVVLNHAGSEHWWMDDLPTNDWLNNQNKPYIETNHKRETLHDPHAVAVDQKLFNDGWFVSTMPDLNQRNPFMATYLIQNAIWWVESANLSGIRVDTYSYPDKAFLTQWTKRLTQEYPNINIVGEEWTTNPAITSYWQRGKQNTDGYVSYLPSVMDFPLQDNVVKGLMAKDSWNSGLNEIYRTLANDFLYPDPDNLVVFADNHDMSRIYTQLNEDIDLYNIAMTYFATTRGIPQIYYGTEILMANPGTTDHGVIRTDFPGGWQGDEINAFTGHGLSQKALAAKKNMKRLLNWRKTADAIHHGNLKHYAPNNGIYVYFRQSKKQKIMVVINKSSETKYIAKDDYIELIQSDKQAKNVLTNGQHTLSNKMAIPAKSALIWELKK